MSTRLQAPEGMTDVSFGGDNFKVGEDGIVEVPDEACVSLYQFGFSNVPDTVTTPEPTPEPTPTGRTRRVAATEPATGDPAQ